MASMIFLMFALLPLVMSYENNFDKPLHFQCPTGQSIKRVYSVHHNHFEDRRYGFSCGVTPNLGHCRWSGYVNNFDDPVLYQCPSNGVVAGVFSYHDNGREDRRFKFYCCSLTGGKILKSCAFSSYANNWDAFFSYSVPSGSVLKGVFSYHDNGREDRRWRFETCKVQ